MSTTTSTIVCDGLKVGGSSSTEILAIKKGTVSVVVPAVSASSLADVDVTITGAAVGDVVIVNPTDTAMETDLGIVGAWVATADTVTIRLYNNDSGAAATGSTQNWKYLLIQS